MKLCDYCGLEAKISGFEMDHEEGKKIFCCEGCKAIYKLFGAMPDVKNKKPDSIVTPNRYDCLVSGSLNSYLAGKYGA